MWIYQAILIAVTLTVTVNPHPHPDGLQTYAPGHDNYKPTDYSFSYGVKDYHTGDIKHQWEKKNGDQVIGHYSLVEPDGSIRSVDYSADEHNGFNAVVKHTGTFKHPASHNVYTKEEPTSHNELILKQKLEEPIQEQHLYEYTNKAPQYKQSWQQQEEANYQTEDESLKENFVYVNKEEVAEESPHSAFKSNPRYKPHNHNAIRSQLTIKEEYGDVKLSPELPIDLSLIKEHSVQPVDVSIVDPVGITLKSSKYSSKDTSIQPSHELSEEEIFKYLEHYYQQNNVPSEPYVEGGFVPIKNKPKELITQPNIPGTYTSNKKPKTTPGLSTFTSKGAHANRHTRRNPKSNRSYLKKPFPQFHYYVPVVETVDESLYGSLANNGLGRYAKYLNYQN